MTTSKPNCVLKSRPKNYFNKEKIMLKIFGLSLMENNSFGYKIYSFLFLFIVNYSYPILQLGDIFKHDFDVVADIITYEFCVFVGMAKTTAVLLNRRKILKIFSKLEEEPFTPNPDRGGNTEEKLLRDCLSMTTAQTIAYWMVASLAMVLGMLYTLIVRIQNTDYHKWQFTYGPLTILNVTYSPNYEISWLYQNLAIVSIGMHFTTIDLITAGVLVHMSYQFRILQNYIGRLAEKSYKALIEDEEHMILPKYEKHVGIINPSVIPWKYLKATLKDIVLYHLAILNIIEEIEEVFSSLLLLVFLGTLGMNCFLIYKASLLSNSSWRLMRTFGEATTTCLQVFIICYWGEKLLFEGQQVGGATFDTTFVGADLRLQKGLAFIIRRSQFPSKLTAGKFADICLATFTWTLRASYSAFMVLQSNSKT